MKKLLYLFLLFFFVCCSEAPKEQQIVMEYLKYNPDNFRRYKPLEWGKLDTIYSKVEDDPTYKYIKDRLVDYISLWESTVYQATRNGYVTREQDNAGNAAYRWIAAYTKMADSIETHYIPHLTGYSIRHKYRAKKNTDNVVVYDEVFVLDSTLTKVVEVKKE